MYGVAFDQHDDRYARTSEWLDVVDGVWSQPTFTHTGRYYTLEEHGARAQAGPQAAPSHLCRRRIGSGEESHRAEVRRLRHARRLARGHRAPRIADMRDAARALRPCRPCSTASPATPSFAPTEQEARREVERITDVKQNASGYANYQQWLQGTQLERAVSVEEYSVSNRGLRSGLVGTPSQVQDQIDRFDQCRSRSASAAVQPATRGNGALQRSRYLPVPCELRFRASE